MPVRYNLGVDGRVAQHESGSIRQELCPAAETRRRLLCPVVSCLGKIVCPEVREDQPVEEGERQGDRLKLEHLDLLLVVECIDGCGVDGMSCGS